MASKTITKSSSTFYTIYVTASVSSQTATTATISWNSYITFGSWYEWGVRLKTYVNGSQVKSIAGVTTSKNQTCCSGSGTVTINKTHSSQTISFSATSSSETVSGYGGVGSSYTGTASGSLTVSAKSSYTVSYNANGGSGAPSSQTKWAGETLTLSSTKPTRDGYTFAGWGTSASATGVSYAAGGSYTANSAITLYAVWTVNATCTIAYDANGGVDAPASQKHVYGTTSTLTTGIPTRYGYEFVGWATSSTATSAKYASGASYTNNSFSDGDTITLYAVWTEVDSCTIVYNANGGTNAPSSQTHYVGTKSTITEDKPTRDSYKFLGWTDDSSSSIIKYSAGGVYENDDFTDGDSITLYAIWMRSIDIKVRVPSGSTLKAVHIRVPDGTGYGTDNLLSSDGYSLVSSSGEQMRVKETN